MVVSAFPSIRLKFRAVKLQTLNGSFPSFNVNLVCKQSLVSSVYELLVNQLAVSF